jgi:hypothetical protein
MYQECEIFCWRSKIQKSRIAYLNLQFEEYIGVAFDNESIGSFLEEAIELLLSQQKDNSKLFSFTNATLDMNSPECGIEYENLLNIERFDFNIVEILVESNLYMNYQNNFDNSLSPVNTQLIEDKIIFNMDIEQFSNFVHAVTTTSIFYPLKAFSRCEKLSVFEGNMQNDNIQNLLFFQKRKNKVYFTGL